MQKTTVSQRSGKGSPLRAGVEQREHGRFLFLLFFGRNLHEREGTRGTGGHTGRLRGFHVVAAEAQITFDHAAASLFGELRHVEGTGLFAGAAGYARFRIHKHDAVGVFAYGVNRAHLETGGISAVKAGDGGMTKAGHGFVTLPDAHKAAAVNAERTFTPGFAGDGAAVTGHAAVGIEGNGIFEIHCMSCKARFQMQRLIP